MASKEDRKMYKVVPLTYSEGVPSIFVRGEVASKYVEQMFLGMGHTTLRYPEGYYPEFDGSGSLK